MRNSSFWLLSVFILSYILHAYTFSNFAYDVLSPEVTNDTLIHIYPVFIFPTCNSLIYEKLQHTKIALLVFCANLSKMIILVFLKIIHKQFQKQSFAIDSSSS